MTAAELPGLPLMHLSMPLAFFVFTAFLLDRSTAWSASSVIDAAADLLEQGDLILREQSDPLLISIGQHDLAKNDSTSYNSTEKFLVPILTSHVGDNNQLMEYMTAAVVARATKRTLCLTPFFSGPSKHGGQLPRLLGSGLAVEDRYDIESLSKFVKVTPLERCLKKCDKRLDSFWSLRGTRRSHIRDWTWNSKTVKTHDLAWSFVSWTSTEDIDKTFHDFEEEHCVALGGLFPGLRWRGAYLAASAYIRPSRSISSAATAIQERAIGANRRFLAVHWRFEESNCKGYELGLCFTRCGDGSIIDSGLHPAALEWMELGKHSCPRARLHIRGVSIAKEDLIDALRERASKDNTDVLYLATDGWMRGRKEQGLVKEVVNSLRQSGLAVVGLWKIQGLPNFSDGSYFKLSSLSPILPGLTGHSLSQIEQEICYRASSFLGSGESTWSLSVFRSRLAGRRNDQLRQASKAWRSKPGKTQHELVIERLLGDEHAAGLQCRYHAYFNRAKVNTTSETYEDEAPDGWLDIEACESRIGRGGKCKVATCF